LSVQTILIVFYFYSISIIVQDTFLQQKGGGCFFISEKMPEKQIQVIEENTNSMKQKIYTIGHSTRSIEEFASILQKYKIRQLVDIRTIPKSRRNPQYGQENLEESLAEAGIKYIQMKDLGGLRPAVKETKNAGWKNQSFRNYADYMQSADFAEAVEELKNISHNAKTVMMCAEAVPWRCHRRLVGDALLIREVEVIDIFDEKNSKPHLLTSFAKVEGEKITYPTSTEEEE